MRSTEVVVAPCFEPEALEILRAKKNIRLLVVPQAPSGAVETRPISGGLLMQATDRFQADGDAPENWTLATGEAASPEVLAEQWEAYYAGLIESLQPGVTEIIVHPAYDDAEMRAATIDHRDYGAAWRQRDLDTVTNPALERLLEQHDVHLITWREIGTLLQ